MLPPEMEDPEAAETERNGEGGEVLVEDGRGSEEETAEGGKLNEETGEKMGAAQYQKRTFYRLTFSTHQSMFHQFPSRTGNFRRV